VSDTSARRGTVREGVLYINTVGLGHVATHSQSLKCVIMTRPSFCLTQAVSRSILLLRNIFVVRSPGGRTGLAKSRVCGITNHSVSLFYSTTITSNPPETRPSGQPSGG
jgi:hypothetical protein